MEIVLSSFFKMIGKNKTISVQVAITLDKVVSLTTNQNAAVVVVMILLESTRSELTFLAFNISSSICL